MSEHLRRPRSQMLNLSSSFQKKKSIADIHSSPQIIKEVDFLQNYQEVAQFIKLDFDLNPTQEEINQVAQLLEQYLPEIQLVALTEQLYRRKCYQNSNDQKTDRYQELKKPIQLNQKKEKIFRRKKYDKFQIKYSYDSTPVPEYRKMDQKMESTQFYESESTFNTNEKNMPLFRNDVPYNYEEKHFEKQRWTGSLINQSQLFQEDLKRHKQKVLAARALVYRGYGYPQLREELLKSQSSIKIDPNRYKTVSCSSLVDPFRKIQEYINEKFDKKYIPLNSIEFKSIHSILFNYKNYFPKQVADTFEKIIKLTYSLQQQIPQLCPFEVMQLYRYLMITKQQKKAIGEYRISRNKDHSTFRIHDERKCQVLIPNNKKPNQFWSRERETMLIDIYYKKKVLADVRYFFIGKYPELKTAGWFDYNFIKNRIDKIYRQVLRKIQMIIPRQQIVLKSRLIIDDLRIKQVVKSPHSLQLRLLLAQIYRDDSFNTNNISEVARLMNEFFSKQMITYTK